MRILITLFFLIFIGVNSHSQTKSRLDSLALVLDLSKDQKEKLAEINRSYLKDMDGIKDRAATGYNLPKHIQSQHVYTLLRRFGALGRMLTPEKYKKIREIDFDIYPYKEWLSEFYKKNKLPSIQDAVAKKEVKLDPVKNQSP